MRAHTSLRSAFRIGLAAAAAFGTGLVASSADAADVTLPGSRGVNSSVGTAALKYEHLTGLDTTIDTGFKELEVFVKVGVRALVRIDPVEGAGPLYTIDMPRGALLEASWGNDRRIVFRALNGVYTDGIFRVRHSLTPTVEMRVKLPIINAESTFRFEATDLLNKIPGARFYYDSWNQQQFAPWGFLGADVVMNAPNLDTSQLFGVGFDDMGLSTDQLAGSLSLNATTNPKFTFKMTRVVLAGAANGEISNGGEASMNAIDGDYLDMNVAAFGEVTAQGELQIRPHVKLTRAFDYDIPDFDFALPVGPSTPYTVPPNVISFQNVIVHIPLPNVHVPRTGIDFGSVKAGGSATKTIRIDNSGEMPASVRFESTDSQFSLPSSGVTIEPKGSYDLQVRLSPRSSGAASGEIKVLSNDPDSPEQIIRIGANGADVGNDDDEDDDSSTASGCGCKTAGAASPSWAGLGLFGLGALVFARRRRAR